MSSTPLTATLGKGGALVHGQREMPIDRADGLRSKSTLCSLGSTAKAPERSAPVPTETAAEI